MDDVIREYLMSRDWERFIPDEHAMHSGDVMGELPSGIRLSEEQVVVAMMHASVANFARALGCNVYSDGSAGFLTGPEFSKLSSVNRIHSPHSPNRLYDLNTTIYHLAVSNSVENEFNVTPWEAREKHMCDGLIDETGLKILELVLNSGVITRMSGRPFCLQEFSKYHQQKVSCDSPRKVPYYPSVDSSDMSIFVEFVKGTCADEDGRVVSMSKWTGMGDASSIPPDCRKPLTFCNFVMAVSTNISGLARDIAKCIEYRALHIDEDTDDTILKAGELGTREYAVNKVKLFCESFLQKDKLQGCEFKANQVSPCLIQFLFLPCSAVFELSCKTLTLSLLLIFLFGAVVVSDCRGRRSVLAWHIRTL